MGAWGIGIFDDDTAYDFFEDIEADAPAFFARSFRTATAADYLEYDDGIAALVSAAYLDNLLNGTTYDHDHTEEEGITNVNHFAKYYSGPSLGHLVPAAVEAVRSVRTGNSELRELWEENEEDYPTWQAMLEALEQRLSSSGG